MTLTAPPDVAESAYRFRFEHVHTLLAPVHPDDVKDEMPAALLGERRPVYRDVRDTSRRAVAQAVEELLDEDEFRAGVAALPFTAGQRVVAFGDSITSDWQSWSVLLDGALVRLRPRDSIEILNAGISGNTTMDIIRRFSGIAALQPDWLLTLIGTNDSVAYGPPPAKTLVSVTETEHNLHELVRLIRIRSRPIATAWITPPPCDNSQLARHPYAGRGTVRIDTAALAYRAELVRGLPGVVVDAAAAFGPPPCSALLVDGVHPTLAGQLRIVRAVVAALGSGRPSLSPSDVVRSVARGSLTSR